ncbi:MAG: XrtA system polysaccharide deacetylase [Kiloniellaceae bacterium]
MAGPVPHRTRAQKECGPAHAATGRIANAMTVDVEDYFQVSAFADKVAHSEWDLYPNRVERNVEAVLQIFADHGVRATFFTLGWIAKRHPALVGRIVAGGHELASHGFQHVRVHEQTPEEFRGDIRQTKRVLEDISGSSVKGYRAASFSIGERTPWAFEILGEEGYAYSSSIYPIRHDLYGMPEAPRFAFQPAGAAGLLEIPISTISVFGRNFPCGGGGYFRLLPYKVSRWAMRRVNRHDRQPCIFYFHPWEIDPEQPRFQGISPKTRFRHYTNLRRMEERLHAVLSDFAWGRMDRIFLGEDAGVR